jgi:hypothetical protein
MACSYSHPIPVSMGQVGLFDRSKAPAPGDYVTTSQIKDFAAKLDSMPSFLWMAADASE